MSTFTLYASSAPIFSKYLTSLKAWLDKAEAHAGAKKFETSVLCATRLAPDMLNLTGQIHLVTAFAKNAVCRLASKTAPDFQPLDASFDAYRARIDETLAIIGAIPADAFQGAETREIIVQLGPDRSMPMTGQDYLLNFVLPNFYFHATTAYAILRQNGVELGKADFMGVPK
jgi:hypothetical protein